jgi:hypothetical protein
MVGRDDEPEPGAGASTPFDSVVGRMEAQLARGRPSGAIDPPAGGPAAVARRGRGAAGARGYVTGIAIGVAIAGVLVQCWLAHRLAAFDLDPGWTFYTPGSFEPPFVVRTGWRIGAPVVLAGLVVLAHVLTGRGKRWPAIVVAVVALATPALSIYLAEKPFHTLAGNIRAE